MQFHLIKKRYNAWMYHVVTATVKRIDTVRFFLLVCKNEWLYSKLEKFIDRQHTKEVQYSL